MGFGLARVYCNSTSNAKNSTRLRLVLLRATLVLLIPNSTVSRAITYTNRTAIIGVIQKSTSVNPTTVQLFCNCTVAGSIIGRIE